MTASCIDSALIRAAEAAMRTLNKKALSVVTAESCTAGLIAAALAQAEGASQRLHGGFVVYTKENKAAVLGVSQELLARHGSVNSAVAEQLATGALERSPADIALSVTGVLGPEKDEDGNPVGLVYFGCSQRVGTANIMCRVYGERPHDELRGTVVLDALHFLADCAGGGLKPQRTK